MPLIVSPTGKVYYPEDHPKLTEEQIRQIPEDPRVRVMKFERDGRIYFSVFSLNVHLGNRALTSLGFQPVLDLVEQKVGTDVGTIVMVDTLESTNDRGDQAT